MGRHVQCVVNFADNLDEDGGTLVVPYFHRYMNAWNKKHNKLRKNIPWVSLPKDVEAHYLEYAHRISMKEVSWNFSISFLSLINHILRVLY